MGNNSLWVPGRTVDSRQPDLTSLPRYFERVSVAFPSFDVPVTGCTVASLTNAFLRGWELLPTPQVKGSAVVPRGERGHARTHFRLTFCPFFYYSLTNPQGLSRSLSLLPSPLSHPNFHTYNDILRKI